LDRDGQISLPPPHAYQDVHVNIDKLHAHRLRLPCIWAMLQGRLLGEYGELAAAVTRDIYMESPQVSWSDIAGLEEAKR
jgi:hypothetical protein